MSARTDDRRWIMDVGDLHRFVQLLVSGFDEVIGPVHEGGVIRLRPIRSAADLPIGVVDVQETGTYRTVSVDSSLRFSYGPGPDSLKSIVHPPRSPVLTMRRSNGRLVVDSASHDRRRIAVIGVRGCDIRALGVLERTQVHGPHPDPGFAARRAGLFLVALDCTHPAPTCCCATEGHGPHASEGYDVALTEVEPFDGGGVEYVARSLTAHGADLLAQLVLRPAFDGSETVAAADAAMRRARESFVREIPADASTVVENADHPHWSVVADRCLTCGNCTAVCPTCFCTDMDDVVSLDGADATRHRVWDTCFSLEFSALGGGPHRSSPMSRYRQWLTHKVGTWHEQFGESGCVGCGRCITWCPVGIDLTAELESLGRPPVEVRA